MLYYNSICLHRIECFYITITFTFWLSLNNGRDFAIVIVLRLTGTVLMTVLYFLMTVFSYSMFYRMNCIMFTFTISSFLWNVGLWGREES